MIDIGGFGDVFAVFFQMLRMDRPRVFQGAAVALYIAVLPELRRI